MQILPSKSALAIMLSFCLLSISVVEAGDGEGKQIEIDSKDGKEKVTINESQTGDQSGTGTAVTDDPVDDDKTTDKDDNTDKSKYQE